MKTDVQENDWKLYSRTVAALSYFALACRAHGLVYETFPVGSLGKDEDSKREAKTESGKIPGDLWQCLPSSYNLKVLALKRAT